MERKSFGEQRRNRERERKRKRDREREREKEIEINLRQIHSRTILSTHKPGRSIRDMKVEDQFGRSMGEVNSQDGTERGLGEAQERLQRGLTRLTICEINLSYR